MNFRDIFIIYIPEIHSWRPLDPSMPCNCVCTFRMRFNSRNYPYGGSSCGN